MKRLFLSAALALFVALGFSSAPASAGTITLMSSQYTNLGGGDSTSATQLNPGSFQLFHGFGSHNTHFVDTFKIDVNLKTALNFDIKTTGIVDHLFFNLYDHTGAGTPLETLSIASDPAGDPTHHYIKITGALLASIVAEPFVILQITGAVCSCATYTITATPVPPALLMFLTALGGMALAGFWRSKGGALLRAA